MTTTTTTTDTGSEESFFVFVLFFLYRRFTSKEENTRSKNGRKYGRRCIRRARIEDSGEKRTRETSAREEDCGFVEEIDFFARRARGRGK
jgi:hypothetical protein